MAGLEKAVFEVYEKVDSASPMESFKVLFNPSEYSIDEGAEYKSYGNYSGTSGLDKNDKKNFAGAKNRVLSLELFFDTSEEKILGKGVKQASDVSRITSKFVKNVYPKGQVHMPPVVCFKWGPLHFRGYVENIRTTYTMFTREGKPVRAKMNLSIIAVKKSSEQYSEPFESPDRTKARTVTDAVSIFDIARMEYDNPDMWRLICEANNIADPLDIPSGTLLKVPALD